MGIDHRGAIERQIKKECARIRRYHELTFLFLGIAAGLQIAAIAVALVALFN